MKIRLYQIFHVAQGHKDDWENQEKRDQESTNTASQFQPRLLFMLSNLEWCG